MTQPSDDEEYRRELWNAAAEAGVVLTDLELAGLSRQRLPVSLWRRRWGLRATRSRTESGDEEG